MFIPARNARAAARSLCQFQSRDWVDVYSGFSVAVVECAFKLFQSRDWVDVYSGFAHNPNCLSCSFQSRDWVDVYSGKPFFDL